VTRAKVIRALLVAAVVIGVAVDGFFAIINFYPIAPHRSRGPARYVVMALDEVQAKWFESNVLDDFNRESNVDLRLIRVDDESQLQTAVTAAEAAGKDVVGVTLPVMQLDHAIDTKLVQSYEGAIGSGRIAQDLGELGDKLLAIGKRGGVQTFLPRMTVVDVLVYRVSKVRDAILHWTLLRPQINAALARINGHGLPATYDLNLSPDQWDSYDIFVLSYYWAHRRYEGKPARPRVAHRTGDTVDGQVDISAGLYGMGATDDTFGTFDSRAAQDYFQWEALYRSENLYPSGMYGPKPFGDDQVIAALAHGDVFLAPIDALDAFSLHGGAHAGAIAQVDDPADLEFTELPNGASLALGPDFRAQRRSPSFSFRQDWVWALPSHAHAVDVGYRFVQFLWRPEIHARECEALGMLPVHPEIVSQRVSRFRLEWMTHVFEAGLEQAAKGKAIPPSLVSKGLGSVYAQLWQRVAGGEAPIIVEAELAAALRTKVEPRPLALATSVPPAPPAAGSAAPPKIDEDTEESIDQPPPEVSDWEADVVFDGIGSDGAKGSAK
jgi:hypothetical protein